MLPQQEQPCDAGACWGAPSVTPPCGVVDFDEDFSTGKYNVHEHPVMAPGEVSLDLTLSKMAGTWSPALLVRKEDGTIVSDGVIGWSETGLKIEVLNSGQGSEKATVRITAQQPTQLYVFVTGWEVVDSGFLAPLPAEAKYQLSFDAKCEPPAPGELLSPPNFDPNNIKDGYFLLPESNPPGLYTRKADDCSRGTKLLIDVLYTVATHWKKLRPELAPIKIMDLNEGSCSSVDHATHDDGTHVDLSAGCATQVACKDNQPAIDLAKLFVDTGKTCGIINNDTDVQTEVNAYFGSKFSYKPWHGTFMRSVSGHTHHFHVRVLKPDGKCN